MKRTTLMKGLLVLAISAAPTGLADEPRAAAKKVPVQADVVLASTKPGPVDPTLVGMQATLGSRVKYLALKRLSSAKLELTAAPATVALPNQKTAELSLVGLKDNVAQVQVKVPPVDATYSLGKDRSLYLQAGPLGADDLWLVLSQPK
jgi:hypothetical protein